MCTQADSDDEDDQCLTMPKTRADCASVPRPCPFLRCKWNLQRREIYSTGRGNGNLVQIRYMEQPADSSCTLDLAARFGMEHEDIARILGVSRQRVGQIEEAALRKIAPLLPPNPSVSWLGLYNDDMQDALWAAQGEQSRTQSAGGC